MKSLPTFVATAALSLSLAVPAQVIAQDRIAVATIDGESIWLCLLYTSPSPRDG